MKLIVGLGNPGQEYEGTRHNIGFDAVLAWASDFGLVVGKKGFSSLWGKGTVQGQDVLILLPQTYMNLSGRAVREAMDYYKASPEEVVVVHDDLDLGLGRTQWAFQSGAAGHRGVTSTIEHLGTKAFYRVRMGIGRPPRKEEVESYVLSRFLKSEKEIVVSMIEETKSLINQWIANEGGGKNVKSH